LAKEGGEGLLSPRAFEAVPSAAEATFGDGVLRWLGGLGIKTGTAVEVCLDVRHVNGAVRQQAMRQEADGLARELAEQAPDFDRDVSGSPVATIVAAVPAQALLSLRVIENAFGQRMVVGRSTKLHPPKHSIPECVATLYRGSWATIERAF
jgi:hypothetical protein